MFEEAYIYYNLALEIVPRDQRKKLQNQLAICLKVEGMILKRRKKYADANQRFDQALNACTDDYEDRYSLIWWKSETLSDLGQFAQAKIFLEQAYSLAPKEKKKEIRNQKALLLKKYGIELSKGKFFLEALAKFNEALEKCSDDYDQKYSLLWSVYI